MLAHTVDYKGDVFSLCRGDMPKHSFFGLVYRNTLSPEQMNGNITQWLYLTKGSAKLVIDGVTEITYHCGELFKLPNLYRKKIQWHGFDEDVSWISFNPNPYTDDYNAAKIQVGGPVVLEPVDFSRYLVLFDGDCTAINQNNYSVTLEQSKTVKISPGSSITLSSQHGCVVGLFWRSDAVL
jgi:hypothetical protein